MVPNSIASNYTGSSIKFYSLVSFYFGCRAAAQNNEANAAIDCDIAVNGYDYYGNAVGEQTFSFAPGQDPLDSPVSSALFESMRLQSTDIGVQMYKAILPASYSFVRFVTTNVATSTLTNEAAVVVLDSLVHYNYHK